MADWQERVQSLIIGFVFAYMVMKLFSVISSFRAVNLRVTCASDEEEEDALLVPSETVELAAGDERTVPLVGTDEETEADGGDGQEDRAHDSSSSSSDSEHEDDAAPASRSRGIDSTHEAAVSEVDSKDEDVETKKDEEVISKNDERVEDVEKTESKDVITPDEQSLEAFSDEAGGDFEEEFEDEDETDDWEGVESTELEKLFGAASTYADTMVTLPGVNSSSEAMLQLHAFYKIATEGPCSSSQSTAFQPTGRAKWNAWQKLGSMPQEEAMQKYIAVLAEMNPIWYEDYWKSKKYAKEASEQKDGDFSESSGGMEALSFLVKGRERKGTSRHCGARLCILTGRPSSDSKKMQ